MIYTTIMQLYKPLYYLYVILARHVLVYFVTVRKFGIVRGVPLWISNTVSGVHCHLIYLTVPRRFFGPL